MDDDSETLRISLLTCTNASNDPLIVQGLANIRAFAHTIATDPTRQIGVKFGAMNIAKLQAVGTVANMGNAPATVASLSKQIFADENVAITAKVTELNYLKAAHIAVTQYAVTGEYHNGTKVDMPKLREDVQAYLTGHAVNLGRAEGVAAAAKAKAAPAPAAGPDVHMG